MARISLEHIDKVYPNGYVAARDLSLEVNDGELLVLVGPSGSGKSTVLRLMAGLERVTDGVIRIGDRDVTDLPPQQRDIAMVFQNYALYPHMTVRDNLGFGLAIRKQPRETIDARVNAIAASLGLDALLDRKPAQLSGGQRQRVALGRAIVREPLAFLFDEPLSNLDAQLRVETRVELSRLHRKLGATMVYVTHDQSEALTLGDRIAVLKDGVLQQIATPMELYQKPANKFVAGFIGSPAMNFIEGVIQRSAGDPRNSGMCTFKGIDLTLDVPCDNEARGRVFLGVRPQHIEVTADGQNRPRAEVGVVEPMGNEQIVYVTLSGGDKLVAVAPPQDLIKPGDMVSIRISPEGVHIFDAETGKRIDPSPQPIVAR
ncbi:MAG TPA: sn-glycerol-3-phosphate ABC transporter ATP-binding protein UgpC [Gemmatimonadaceae bacterium]|jgi:multiple sugar transport system ATP-binding protein|nr:sn-glycerol-3-phosphate ABC transporter ATP-binding protein UgpC [Gemmatimonadaceae bacterium]